MMIQKLNKYKIDKYEKYDKFGNLSSTHYQIREKRKFLFFEYWGDVTYTLCDYGGCYPEPYQFDREKEAQHFIDNQLCNDVPREETIVTEVRETSCKGGGMMI